MHTDVKGGGGGIYLASTGPKGVESIYRMFLCIYVSMQTQAPIQIHRTKVCMDPEVREDRC